MKKKKRTIIKSPKQNTAVMSSQKKSKQIPIVGIGASAGGLSAFKDFFISMPSDTGMAFVLVQHLDPTHDSLMVDLLSRHTKMPVTQIENKMEVEENNIYMIPPNNDLFIKDGKLELLSPQQRRGMRLPINLFFNSLAEDQQEKAICIILSGTGSDGTMGLKTIKSFGGLAVVQEPTDAQYDGMPTSAISTGVVDYILPVNDMADKLIKYIKHSYIRGYLGTEAIEINEPDDFNSILVIMNAQLGHNFHYYKKNTVIRRINRRIGLKQLNTMKEYVAYLRNNPDETQELFKDLLIGVTNFFREIESWKYLEKNVFPSIFKKKKNSPIRVWVTGCSSGEEAYTLSILLHEQFQKLNIVPDFQIFATDIDSNALEFARTGRYSESIASDIPGYLLEKYFIKEDGFYQVVGKLRENIVFSVQNLISDPPFSKLDLITCRNLLIYLETTIQEKVFQLFHFSLKTDGVLMLGNSETIGHNEDLFDSISKKMRIFRRNETAVPTRGNFPIVSSNRTWGKTDGADLAIKKTRVKSADIVKETLLSQYAPISILISKKHEILYHFGDTAKYLRYPTGDHTNDLYSLIREGMLTRLRGAVHKAKKTGKSITIPGTRVKRQHKYHKVEFTVAPISESHGVRGLFMISFRDVESPGVPISSDKQIIEEDSMVLQLEHELSSTKEELQNTIEELETSNEELKTSNEEVMSMNEELQSSNEELETSKEELQSLNEELSTMNVELQEKIRTQNDANNDLTNLINSTNTAVIFLDTQLVINFYTPQIKKLYNLIPTDIGRPISDVVPRFEDKAIFDDAKEVLNTLIGSTREIQNSDGLWYKREMLPYRTQDGRIEGLVLSFDDITKLKATQLKIEEQVHEKTKELQRINELLLKNFSSIYMMTAHLDLDFNFIKVNDLLATVCKSTPEKLIGKNFFSIFSHSKEDKEIFERVIIKADPHFIFSQHGKDDNGLDKFRIYDWTIQPIQDHNKRVESMLITIVDITERDERISGHGNE